MTFHRIVEGLKACLEAGEEPDYVVADETFYDEIINDNKYHKASGGDDLDEGEVRTSGYTIKKGDGNYVLSESNNKYDIPDNV